MGKFKVDVFSTDALFDQIQERVSNPPIEYGLDNRILDQHLKITMNQFNVIQGMPSSGKTTWTMWWFARLAELHGLKFCIYSGENEAWELGKKIVEFANRKPFEKVQNGKEFLVDHFRFIKDDNEMPYTGESLLDVFEVEDCDVYLIDPHTSLDLGGKAHDYNTNLKLIQRIRSFVKKKPRTLFLSLHVTKEQQMRTHDKKHADFAGLVMPPEPGAGAGGVWLNRADNLYTIHRYIHASEQRFKETNMVFVDKIKIQDTGIYPTSRDHPLQFRKSGYAEYSVEQYNKNSFSQADKIAEYEERLGINNDETPF